MGDFHEHVLFGLLVSLVVSLFSSDLISLSFSEAFLFFSFVLIGSVLPDIDHENSYVHRAVKNFVCILSGGMVFYLLPVSFDKAFLAGSMVFLVVYFGFSFLKFTHRGFTHSFVFLVISSSIAVILVSFFAGVFVPGFGMALGVFSHLLLDGEFKLK